MIPTPDVILEICSLFIYNDIGQYDDDDERRYESKYDDPDDVAKADGNKTSLEKDEGSEQHGDTFINTKRDQTVSSHMSHLFTINNKSPPAIFPFTMLVALIK